MIAIVKYNAGNSRSVKNALDRLGVESSITTDPHVIANAGKVIFPGVGEAGSAMKYLVESGLDQVLKDLKQPFLGICLGMQLMCRSSEESSTNCMGIFDADVLRFPPEKTVPHMGWNNCRNQSSALFENVKPESDYYFVHNYYAKLSSQTIAICDYILPFSAALQKDNFYGVQFHPEKSGLEGELILKNFLSL